MLKNYFLIGWRNLVRARGYSAINIIGLATGMAITILVALWVLDEFSFNTSFKNYDRLGQVYHHIAFGDEIVTINDVPAPLGEALETNYTHYENVSIASWPLKHVLSQDDKKRSETGMFISTAFLDMFSVDMLQGTHTAFKDANTIMISKTFAETFSDANPVGQMIKFDNRDQLMVTGVFEDFPANSNFAEVKYLIPMAYFAAMNPSNKKSMTDWEDYGFQCFVLLNSNASFEEAGAKIKKLLFEKGSEDVKSVKPDGFIFPMNRWHLHDEFKNGQNTGGGIKFVWMIGTIGIFVLVLAAINFMNLSTARSQKRSKEVGIRKVMGSAHKQLVFQFLTESFLIVVIALLIALLIAALSLPWFNQLADKKIEIPWSSPNFIVSMAAFVCITSMLAGSYPALYLSSFSPVTVLKGTFRAGRPATLPRRVMVVFQFTVSIVLIAETIIVYQQIGYAKDRPVGFDRHGIFHLEVVTERLSKSNYNSLRDELLKTGVVENMAISDRPITGSATVDAALTWEGKDPTQRALIAMNNCSHDFPKTNGFEFIEGRDFSRSFSTDSVAVIVNELAANVISKDGILGKKIKCAGREREIIGVIKDQVRSTPFIKQLPQLYFINYAHAGYITVRLAQTGNVHSAMTKVETVIRKFDDAAPFDYRFLDDDYAQQFKTEERIGNLASVFSFLTIMISSIGIFGLSAFASHERAKEIGIRKVLGASSIRLWMMLSTDFVKLVIASILIGTPMAYYFASEWLQQYDYRIEVSWIVFAVTGLSALVITIVTVSYQALKAAMMNPVDSIRTE